MNRTISIALLTAFFQLLNISLGNCQTHTSIILENHSGGFYTINKPRGWNMITAGNCTSFSFLIQDPTQNLRQLFYFGEVGPVYLSSMQKEIDQQYMSLGGYQIAWFEMPVVDPLTPENFLEQFHLIAQTQIAQDFMSQCPKLMQLEIISVTPQQSSLQGGTTSLIRALFKKNKHLGEGLFLVTVAPLMPISGAPGAGTAYGLMITGITAPKQEFFKLENKMVQSIQSFTLSKTYIQKCMQQQQQTYAGIRRAGKTLSETSDIMMKGWENRNKTDDIIAEKRSDVILGKERLYNPETGEVYEFKDNFFENYQQNRNKYEINNLQRIPDYNYDLWMKATKDGYKHIK